MWWERVEGGNGSGGNMWMVVVMVEECGGCDGGRCGASGSVLLCVR